MTYPGGKNGSGVYQTIINQLPPHQVYIEPFLGAGAIMRLKRPARCSIGIDIDSDVITAFNSDEIQNLTLICTDALDFMVHNAIPDDALIYLDPPYLLETRSSKHPLYRFEMTGEQHETLLGIIRRLSCSIAISGYWSDLYGQALHDWRCVSYSARTRGGRIATEYLWMNYPEPLSLHDYRYLGANFRERERIKRKIHRWNTKLNKMPVLERQAILAAISMVTTPP